MSQRLALALLAVSVLGGALGGCAPSAATLDSGFVHVNFTTDETCGFSNPYTVEARGCSRLDEKAVMCKGFGVIDGVLFAGGCEAPAQVELLETQGTMPLSPPRAEPSPEQDEARAAAAEQEVSEPPAASKEPPPRAEKKRRSRNESGSSKKKGKAKKAKAKKAKARRSSGKASSTEQEQR